jgi:hypothetical protein
MISNAVFCMYATNYCTTMTIKFYNHENWNYSWYKITHRSVALKFEYAFWIKAQWILCWLLFNWVFRERISSRKRLGCFEQYNEGPQMLSRTVVVLCRGWIFSSNDSDNIWMEIVCAVILEWEKYLIQFFSLRVLNKYFDKLSSWIKSFSC